MVHGFYLEPMQNNTIGHDKNKKTVEEKQENPNYNHPSKNNGFLNEIVSRPAAILNITVKYPGNSYRCDDNR